MAARHEFFATAPRHLEPLLADELSMLGLKKVKPSGGGVSFYGTLEDAYHAVLWSRVASSVLAPLHRFHAPDPEALYEGIRGVRWWEHLRVDDTFMVDYTATASQVNHTHFGALKVKDAIVDQFRDRKDRRPSVDREAPGLRVNVHVRRDEAVVSVDLSGRKLHQRGWRVAQVEAPLKENVAAAILMRAGWPQVAKQGGALIDPMMGGGTFLIEGAMMALDLAPGLLRAERGSPRWRPHDDDAWYRAMRHASLRAQASHDRPMPLVFGSDIDQRAVNAALENIEEAGLSDVIKVQRNPVTALRPPVGATRKGLIIANPPYGERLGEREEAMQVHRELGEVLIERFMGWHASVLTGDRELGFAIGLRALKHHAIDNGKLACTLLHFDVDERRVWRGRDGADEASS